jgi:uncharacterized cupredoxin-like copper-binding protein
VRRTVKLIVASACAAAALAGCGSSTNKSSSSTTAPGGGQPASSSASHALTVTETEYRLSPATPLAAGGKVTVNVHNAGTTTHALEIENAGPGGKDLRSSDIQPSGATTIVANLKPGQTYQWYCPIDGHKGLGMKGTITVVPASGGGGGGTPSGSAPPASTSGGGGGGSRYP